MSTIKTTLGALGLGAGLMYFMDPLLGARRRRNARLQAREMVTTLSDLVNEGTDDLRYRTRSALANTQTRFKQGEAADWLLQERAESLVRRYGSYPQAVRVAVTNGRVILTGHSLDTEVEPLLARLRALSGVQTVENKLEAHAAGAPVPALQGKPRPRSMRPEDQDEVWSPGLRLLSALGGGALTVYGLSHGGLTGGVLGLAGAALAARGLANQPVKQLALGKGARSIDLRHSITVNAPIDRVYTYFADPSNLARFLDHVKDVRAISPDRMHWQVAGPTGQPLEWDAEITQRVPPESLAWRSLPDQPVRSMGMAHFSRVPAGGTRVTLRLSYAALDPSQSLPALFSADPRLALEQDLQRLKLLLEGEKPALPAASASQPAAATNAGKSAARKEPQRPAGNRN